MVRQRPQSPSAAYMKSYRCGNATSLRPHDDDFTSDARACVGQGQSHRYMLALILPREDEALSRLCERCAAFDDRGSRRIYLSPPARHFNVRRIGRLRYEIICTGDSLLPVEAGDTRRQFEISPRRIAISKRAAADISSGDAEDERNRGTNFHP